jgi:hypothetical protein
LNCWVESIGHVSVPAMRSTWKSLDEGSTASRFSGPLGRSGPSSRTNLSRDLATAASFGWADQRGPLLSVGDAAPGAAKS